MGKQSLSLAASIAGTSPGELTMGRIDGVHADGRILVSFDRWTGMPARTLHGALDGTNDESLANCEVLLLVKAGQPNDVVLIGVICDEPTTAPLAANQASRSMEINGECVEIAADTEIRLTCGRSSVVLQKDGRILIKGERVTSRARGANKIRGATVNVN